MITLFIEGRYMTVSYTHLLHKVITCQFSTLNYFAIFLHSPVANCCRDPSVFLSLIPFTILLYFYCQHRLSGSRIICVDCLTNGFPFPKI